MKAQSFEYQLRNTTPPTPDPEARLRARRAALAEFERIQIGKPTPSAAARTHRRPPSGWWSKNLVLGGIATACVAVIGVALVLRVPPERRDIADTHLRVPVPSEAPPQAERTEQTQTAAEAEAPIVADTQPPPEPAKAAPQVKPNASRQTEQIGALDEVIVAAVPAQSREKDSPSSVAGRESSKSRSTGSETQAITLTTSTRPGFSGLFSRQDSRASAPVAAPSSEGRDKFQHFEINPVKQASDDPVSTFSVDVDTASYSFVRRQLKQNLLPQVDAVRAEEMINYFDYAWPVPESRDPPFKPTVTVSDSPWGEGKKLVHIGIKGYELPGQQRPDVNLVLLLDVSGSMNSPDKLPLAQQSMALLLDSLKPTDTVAIVVYAGAAGEVLAPTPVKNKEAILEALNSLQPGGSTAGAEGIRLAYELAQKNFRKEGVNRILLATDGDFNVGITDQDELKGFVEREREKGVYLSVLSFGQGNYRDEMAQTLAQNGNGTAAYIDTLSEAKRVLVQESAGALFTIAKDVKLQVEFNPAIVAEYRLVGYETRELNREDFNNDKVDAGDVGSGHTVTAIYEITPVGSKAALVDERRYPGHEGASAERPGKANEYGFLKLRYKLPNGIRSRLLEQPIRVDAGVPAALRQDVAFSTAVAGFAQLLRGGKYTGSLSFEDVISEAQTALGEDPYGYRAEFVELVRKAQHARGM